MSQHIFEKLMWATPRQVCWVWDKTNEFYYVPDPDDENERFICQCSACQQNAFPDRSLEHPHSYAKNRLNKHCVYCQCLDCVCELRRVNRQCTLAPRTYSWDNSCMHAHCDICLGH